MKKVLIAVAVAATLPAAAYAQTNVQMYGIADVYLESSNSAFNGGAGSNIAMKDGLQSGSRWGVQGTEDLGGGLSAIFRFEAGQDVDDGADVDQTTSSRGFLQRQSRVGLKGGFGKVEFGRQYNPIFWNTVQSDQTGLAFYVNQYALGNSLGRVSNSINYNNKFGGVTINAMWAPSEDATGNTDDFIGLGAKYNGGNWGASVGYHDQANGTVVQVGGKFSVGSFAVGLAYAAHDATVTTADLTDIALSLALKVGASGKAILNFQTRDLDTGNDSTNIGLSYAHSLSKRTNWYAALGMNNIDNQDDRRRIAVGLRHKF